MDSLTPTTSSQKEALLRRYGATGLSALGRRWGRGTR
jgi:hypothetical protein